MTRPMPRRPAPPLRVETVAGNAWRIENAKAGRFVMLVVYRGLHCPICRGYLKELAGLLPEFAARDIEVLALSSDGRERAATAREQWQLGDLSLGYGLSIETARQWGLYVSAGRGMSSLGFEEPALFAEPGIFLLRPDGTLYAAAISTMPFARPHFRDILSALDFIVKNDYPARGEA